jgi:hypothetical protein
MDRIRALVERIEGRFDRDGAVRQAAESGALHRGNVDEYVAGVHLHHQSLFGQDAPSKDEWYLYAEHVLETYPSGLSQ